MGKLGAPTAKPTTVYSNVEWVDKLVDHFYFKSAPSTSPVTASKFRCETTMKWKITGNPVELKATQEYPVGYGRAWALNFRRYGASLRDAECTDSEPAQLVSIDEIMSPSSIDLWSDARMPEVLAHVRC